MLVRLEYFDGRIPIRVPIQPIDAESELERLNACLQEAHVLSESIRRARGRLFLMPNWRYLRSLHHPHPKKACPISTTTTTNKRRSDTCDEDITHKYKSYTPITVSSSPSSSDCVRVTGFADPKTNQFVTALHMMDKRERFRGCLGLFWREERQRLEDFELQELREANEAISATSSSEHRKRACTTCPTPTTTTTTTTCPTTITTTTTTTPF